MKRIAVIDFNTEKHEFTVHVEYFIKHELHFLLTKLETTKTLLCITKYTGHYSVHFLQNCAKFTRSSAWTTDESICKY